MPGIYLDIERFAISICSCRAVKCSDPNFGAGIGEIPSFEHRSARFLSDFRFRASWIISPPDPGSTRPAFSSSGARR